MADWIRLWLLLILIRQNISITGYYYMSFRAKWTKMLDKNVNMRYYVIYKFNL